MCHFNQPNVERKNCVWTTKYRRLLEICIVQHEEMKKVFFFSTNITTSFYDCKKCKACYHSLNKPFLDQKPTIILFGGDDTHCFARKTSREYEKEKSSPFLRKANHNQAHPNLNQKRQKFFHIWHLRVDTPLVDTVN